MVFQFPESLSIYSYTPKSLWRIFKGEWTQKLVGEGSHFLPHIFVYMPFPMLQNKSSLINEIDAFILLHKKEGLVLSSSKTLHFLKYFHQWVWDTKVLGFKIILQICFASMDLLKAIKSLNLISSIEFWCVYCRYVKTTSNITFLIKWISTD